MSLRAAEMGAWCRFAPRSAGTKSLAPNPSSVRGEGCLKMTFPPACHWWGGGAAPAPVGQEGEGQVAWAPSNSARQAHPSCAMSCKQDGTFWHRVNTRAVWGGSNPLAVFWKDEGFTCGAVGPAEGLRQLAFHPCFFTLAFSLLLSCCRVSSDCFAPPQRQQKRSQWVSNCYRDHLQSFGILLPPEARLMDGDSLTLSTLSSPPGEMKTIGTSVVVAQHLGELSSLPGGESVSEASFLVAVRKE